MLGRSICDVWRVLRAGVCQWDDFSSDHDIKHRSCRDIHDNDHCCCQDINDNEHRSCHDIHDIEHCSFHNIVDDGGSVFADVQGCFLLG